MTAAPADIRGRRRLAAQAVKPQPLPAHIDVLGINHTVTASREFGVYYRRVVLGGHLPHAPGRRQCLFATQQGMAP